MLMLLIVAAMLGSSALSPMYSEASKATVETTEVDQQEAGSGGSLQLASASREPAADQYLGRLALNVARRGHASVALSDGRVAIIGGQNETGPVSEVEVVNAQSQSIEVVATLKVARSRPTATLLSDGRVLVAGGWDQKKLLASTELFNPQTNLISRGPKLRRPRAAHLATVLRDGRILITGGSPDGSAELFDPSTNRTTLLGAKLTAARSFHAASLLGDGNVLLVGGVDQDGRSLRSAEVFDVRAQTFFATSAPMRIKRVRATLHTLPNGKVQVIGGDSDGTMEVYDPALNRFGAAAHLAPAADIFPTSKTLQSRARAALIDSKMTLDESAKADPSKPLHHYSLASKTSLDSFDELLARADYSSAEVPGANRAVIAGGIGKGGEYVRSVVLVESSPATVTTDKAEYSQGERPLISGSGWQPNETVRIVRQEARPGHRRKAIEVVADEKGNFTSGDISVEEFQPGVTYTLTVMGAQSAYIAQTTYGDARLPGSRPKTAKLSLPMLFRDASFELEEGLLVWEMESQVRPGVRPPEMAVTNSSSSETFDFTDIEDKPCFGIPENICPFQEGIDIRLKSNSFITFSGGLEGDLLAGNLKVSESVNGTLIFQVTAEQYDLPPLAIPGTSVKFNVTLGDFEAGLAIGIVARIRLEFNDPGTTFTTTLNFNQNAAIAFTSEGIKPSGDLTASMDFDLVETAGGCVKLSVGPEVSFEATVSGDVCDFGVEAAANIAPFIKGCLNVKDLDTCPTYDVAFSAGIGALVEGTVSFCIFDIEGGADTEFFTLPLPFTFSGNLNDTTPPTILCPADINQATDPGSCGAVVRFPTGASDGLCAAPTVVCSPTSGSFFNKGTTQVTCTATDGAGLTASCSFNVTVSDEEDPNITCPGSITDSNTPGLCGKMIDYTLPTTSDNCGQTSFSCVPDRGSFFNVGTTTVTCTVTDPAGNSNSCSFTVTINDTEQPTITCPSPITKGTDPGMCAAVVNFNATPKDNCALSANAVVCSPPSGTSFAKGTTTVSCTVTDGAGLTANCSFPVTVNDTQAPALSCPAAQTRVTVRPGDPSVGVSYPAPVVSDNCPGVTFICLPPSGSIFPLGTTTVTCNATDTTGNASTCSFTVTVFDIFVQDDSNPATMLLWNSQTGDYRYCCAGSSYAGRGASRSKGGLFTLAQAVGTHRINASLTASVNRGTASLQVGGVNRCPITDRDIRNNSSPCQ